MLFGLFSQVFGVKESIFGVKKAKIWPWKKIAKNSEERKKKKKKNAEYFWKIFNQKLNAKRRSRTFSKKNVKRRKLSWIERKKQATERFKGRFTYTLLFCVLGESFRGGGGGGGGGSKTYKQVWKTHYKTCVPQVKKLSPKNSPKRSLQNNTFVQLGCCLANLSFNAFSIFQDKRVHASGQRMVPRTAACIRKAKKTIFFWIKMKIANPK